MMDNKTNILVTVDVETYHAAGRPLPFETNVLGQVKGKEECGVFQIMKVCEEHGAKATFFVDVYEHHAFGEKPLAELCQRINAGGHSVQLHAHPNWIPGRDRGLMKDYDLEAQRAIISEGRDLLKKWTGKAPVAFRAGAYGANLDTIEALKDNGITKDSSFFSGNANCALCSQLGGKRANVSFKIGDVTEIPVTVYTMFDIPGWNKKSKIDINACSLAELKSAFDKIMVFNRSSVNKLRNVVIFLHSFSFIKWNNSFTRAEVEGKIFKKFVEFIGYIKNRYSAESGFRKMEECPEPGGEADYLPKLGMSELFARFAGRLK